MKKNLYILFTISCHFCAYTQFDSVSVKTGLSLAPDELFIEGYSNVAEGPFYTAFDLKSQNKIIYNSSDSSLFSGTVYFFKRFKRESNNVSTYYYDDYFCEINKGVRNKCESFTYSQGHNAYRRDDYITPDPYLISTKKLYYSNDGKKIDSTFKYDIVNQSKKLAESFIYDVHGNLFVTKYKNDDTTSHIKLTKENIPYGVWHNPLRTIDTFIKVRYLFEEGVLVDVLNKNCLFLSEKNELIDKPDFFNQYANLKNDDFYFISIEELLIPLVDDYFSIPAIKNEYFGDYELILTTKYEHAQYGMPKRIIKKIIRKYNKRHTTTN